MFTLIPPRLLSHRSEPAQARTSVFTGLHSCPPTSLPKVGYPSLYSGLSPMAAALAGRALVSYDLAAGSTTPDLQLQAVVGNVTVIQVSAFPTLRRCTPR